MEPGITAYVVMALAGTLGYLVGSLLGWGIGRYGGQPLLERHGRWFHVTPEKLERAERWFQRYEIWTVFVARMLPVVRSFVSIPAGIAEVRLVPYTLLTFLGTLPWCFGIAGAGYLLGGSWETFHDQLPLDRLRDHRADRARDRVPDRPSRGAGGAGLRPEEAG